MRQIIPLIILLSIIFIYVLVSVTLETFVHDLQYRNEFLGRPWEAAKGQNPVTPLTPATAPRIAIFSFDTRAPDAFKYIALHNKNISDYARAHNYTYVFKDACDGARPHVHNAYWCKFTMIADLLAAGYDYVLWLDTDTIIRRPEIALAQIARSYASDAFMAFDSPYHDRYLNAGVFIIRNSPAGRKILDEIITLYNTPAFQARCVEEDGSLRGKWAQSCYEQGVMNQVMRKHMPHVTILPRTLVHQYTNCKVPDTIFIQHLYATATGDRTQCFETFLRAARDQRPA